MINRLVKTTICATVVALLLVSAANAARNPPKLKVGDMVLLAGPARFIEEDSREDYDNSDCVAKLRSDPIVAPSKNRTLNEIEIASIPVCLPSGFYRGNSLPSDWMQHAEVTEVRGNLVRYRPYGFHPIPGWLDIRGLMTPDQFEPLTAWQSPGTYRYCLTYDGCYELTIEKSGQATLTQTAPTDDCRLVWPDTGGPCRLSGRMDIAEHFLRFQDGSEAGRFYAFDEAHSDISAAEGKSTIALCPVELGATAFKCEDDSWNAVFFTPTRAAAASGASSRKE